MESEVQDASDLQNINEVRCAAILAGGRSSRMGQEKALLPFEGLPLISRTIDCLSPVFERLLVVTANPEVARVAQIPAVADAFTGRGPLGGLHAALVYFQKPTFIVACDMPFLNLDFIGHLTQRFATAPYSPDALVPHSANGIEPLHAIYAPSCIAPFEQFLSDKSIHKTPSLRFVLSQLDTQFLAPEVAQIYGVNFENWNTPGDVPGQ